MTALSLFAKNSAVKIPEMFSELTVDLTHNDFFINAVADALKDVADITVLMRKLLRAD